MRMHQVRDDFGVRVGRERVAERLQPRAHRIMVLDDAVVHHRDAAGDMRMGVALGGHAVRRPAGVADADVAVEVLRRRQLLQLRYPPTRAKALHAAVDHGDAGRVVAAVLEALQPLEQDRHDVAPGYGSDDSAHEVFLRTKSSAHTAVAAAASVTKSMNSALRIGMKSWCSSSSAPKATTEASSASGARPSVPRQRSAVISAKQTKCATLSQPGGMR